MKREKNWLAVEITIVPEASEAIEFAFNELAASGTEINNLGKSQSEMICVIGYFNEQPDESNVRNQLNEALRIYEFSTDTIKKIEWREVENKDWLAEWKKHWKPTKVGKFIVAPTWSQVETVEKAGSQNGEMFIRIDPEMAFGTGTHETTRLCLQAIEENYDGRMSFLDVGTGTGILAIAAAKIKSEVGLTNFLRTEKSILACDTDEKSIEIAQANAKTNGVYDKINFFIGTVTKNTPKFDYVCANLTADVIVQLLPTLIEKTGFYLVLSGILREQQSLIESELKKASISDREIKSLGEWISIKVKVL